MTAHIFINIAFEDALTEALIEALLRGSGRPFAICNRYSRGGFGYIRSKINGFNMAARNIPFFIVTDLDQGSCAPRLKKEWLASAAHNNLIFRIAVREIEAWLLADREAVAGFFSIPLSKLPVDPDSITQPKQFLINLARHSRKNSLKRDIMPPKRSGRAQGPNYNSCLCRFIEQRWNLDNAATNSVSLRKALAHIRRFNPS